MQTELKYLQDTYLYVSEATVMKSGLDDFGAYVLLDSTIFYPQGGGQPSDVGRLKWKNQSIVIIAVKSVADEVRHYTDQNCTQLSGQKVRCEIDSEKRLLHARLHTASHLLSNVVEQIYPNLQAVKGYHFPGGAYVQFSGEIEHDLDLKIVQELLEERIKQNVQIALREIQQDDLEQFCPNLPYAIKTTDKICLIKIGEFAWQPCGGTHVRSSIELSGLNLIASKKKKSKTKVSYVV